MICQLLNRQLSYDTQHYIHHKRLNLYWTSRTVRVFGPHEAAATRKLGGTSLLGLVATLVSGEHHYFPG